GFVYNVCEQIKNIIEFPESDVRRQVFYVGDEPIELEKWVNAFSLGQTGKNVKTVSEGLVKFIALFGDVLEKMNVKFPITSSRFKSMTTSNPSPMDKTFEVLGMPKYDLQNGVGIT